MRTRILTAAMALGTAYVVAVTVRDPRALLDTAPGRNLVIQTTAALVAVLVAVVAIGRFRLRRRAADLFLVLALAQLAASNLLFTVLPLADSNRVGSRAMWAGALTRLMGTLLLAAAAHARLRHVEEADRRYADEAGLAAATAAMVLIAYAAAARLPEIDVGDPAHRLWDTAPGLAAVLGVVTLAGLVAAVGFVRDAIAEPDDQLLPWLAAAAIVSAGSNATTAGTFVSTDSPYVTSADLLKLAAYLLLLGGVLREIRGLWRDRARALLAEERRRIARDLHDGLAQELAFVVTTTRRLARRGHTDLWEVNSAAERALDESRRAIAALTRTDDEPLDVALAHAAEEVGGRLGTRVTLELTEVAVPGETKEALLRIAREAITNAARHGLATRVHVRLDNHDGVRLRVSDNGSGFDVDARPDAGRLGITSMRERAAALGGVLTVSSVRPNGTEVEVVLP